MKLNEYSARCDLDATSRVHDRRRQIPADAWREQFRAALETIHAGVLADLSSDELEREITAARDEVRRGTV